MISNTSQPWKSRLAEIALIFAVFCLQGAWPVPDVNEPYYLGKAIHYWNPDWVRGDFFLDTQDAHLVFYITFGWLSKWLCPTALAWTGRLLTWALLAWSWRRLSWAVVPRPGFAVLSGALFACLIERFHMAGEWIIGGVEAKGFAFVFVFLALEALARNWWNRTWLYLGAASLFHILVGGWAAIAVAFAWLWLGRPRPPIRAMLPGLVGGFLLAVPSLIPAILLDWNVDPETAARAHRIYVYWRLPHHMILTEFKPAFIVRFGVLLMLWALLCYKLGEHGRELRLRAFVVGSLGIALVGAVIGLLAVTASYPAGAAGLLRYYWFRLSDFAVPMGVAILGTLFIDRMLRTRPVMGKLGLAVAMAIALLNIGDFAWQRMLPTIPRADNKIKRTGYPEWREACEWIVQSGKIPKDAKFLTPIDSQTFKWYTGRPEVVNRKDIPQDAKSIVEWWDQLWDIHGIGSEEPIRIWQDSLAELGADELREMGEKYHADYVLTEAPGQVFEDRSYKPRFVVPELPLKVLFKNKGFIIYQLRDGQQNGPPAS